MDKITLNLCRLNSDESPTEGVLSIGKTDICHTLELPKLADIVCIPTGKYELKLTYSKRFNKVLPEVMNVKGRTGIRIHAGNSVNDTAGCILVGRKNRNVKYWLTDSRNTLKKVIEILQSCKSPVEINIYEHI